MKETKFGNAAFTVDIGLSIPGINSATTKQLSDSTGMTITPGPSTGEPLTDQAAANDMAQQAINAIKNSARRDPRGMTRMEYSDSLMQVYLDDRKTWELQRVDTIKEASEEAATDPQSMEKLTRRLAYITAVEEAKLASKYADSVVRGYSHTVRGFMGHLDIKSTAESLQDAKDSFRESALQCIPLHKFMPRPCSQLIGSKPLTLVSLVRICPRTLRLQSKSRASSSMCLRTK